jgi:predicted alpha-1,2-mannosidase
MCEQVVQLKDPDSPVYGCDAFWNTFWNLNLVWSLVTPDVANKWVNSLLETYDRGGWLPKGPAGMEYSGVMVAEHEIALIVGAYQKGIRNFDAGKAYQAMRKMQMEQGVAHGCGGFAGNENMTVYKEFGYVPYEEGSVSNTLEYAYDDWCVAQMAKALGKTDDYEYFLKRSQNYRKVFDPSTGFMRPKSRTGAWRKDFDPMSKGPRQSDLYRSWGNPYTDFQEGNAWQYTFFVPHDVPGLIGLLGKDVFNNRLKDGFEKSRGPKFTSHQYENYINHGNQPNMQAAYLFNWSGMPWETQYWAREIMDVFYGTTPESGYQGDEDEGQMSAWFVISALGLFQMDGGTSEKPIYEIGSPLFEKAVIHLDERYYPGGRFTIEARNNSKANRYIQSALLNGKPLGKPWFYHSELVAGGSLVLVMGPKPNEKWGITW